METSRAEAERLLGIAEKLLRNKDYGGCRDFAILAQETEPLLDGSDQILAIAEVLLASDSKRLNNNQPEWYSVLQVPQRTDEAELIKKQYRRLALLLHPDKNKFSFSDSAFRLVADAWAVLSDPAKKSAYDNGFISRFTKVDLSAMKKQQQKQFNQQKKQQARGDNSNKKLPVRRSARGGASGDTPSVAPSPPPTAAPSGRAGTKANKRSISEGPNWMGNIWTACPYCYNLYEYPRIYEGCCLRCDNENCKRAFTATPILSMPPMVPGSEAYYCCWGFFPMGFSSGKSGKGNVFPKWMPPMFEESEEATPVEEEAPTVPPPPPPPAPENMTPVAPPAASSVKKRGRGRPRKNV